MKFSIHLVMGESSAGWACLVMEEGKVSLLCWVELCCKLELGLERWFVAEVQETREMLLES
jgi:hypothetical protein